ncbi:calcium/sodium antiporter [Pseudooceanicola nanhaiensis]|uniref:calcium/sodium antiporter n=1 Tax=Pseudooceanicola nanhaiensis TaxID=375761 RepID=UPI001CD78218|nr:calcium/sodium antiporter [Pseudooceanicola nanhaiensis]MCA0921144.1 calcium/sodium antiporter [Pseudooceanicola nanhaiensis]
MPWILCGVGLALLVFAGDALVKGAVNLALRLGIPALIVSLTVVAFGTSAPELLVVIDAVIHGKPGLALGNVVGSNTANILLVLGVPAMLATMHSSHFDTRRSYYMMLGATVVFIVFCLTGELVFWHGLVMLLALIATLVDQYIAGRKARAASEAAADEEDLEGADPGMKGWKIAVFLVAGLIGLPLGANLLVDNASIIARSFGISETVIGLTLVAVGTSLPELATTVMAALRKQADVAMGNVIGSNMFNLLGIMGIGAMVGNIPVEESMRSFDLWVMLGASLLLVPFALMKVDITRLWGVVLTALYLVYVSLILF